MAFCLQCFGKRDPYLLLTLAAKLLTSLGMPGNRKGFQNRFREPKLLALLGMPRYRKCFRSNIDN